MQPGTRHEVANLKCAPGELSFEARIGGGAQEIWIRTDAPIVPSADAALAATVMPAMRHGGTLELVEPVSPRVLRTQRDFQAIQRAWSLDWELGEPPLHEVEVIAPAQRPPEPAPGRVAAFFSGGVDSWSTVLENPDVTDLIFVRGLDLRPGVTHQEGLADEVEARLRRTAEELGLPLQVVATNLRELSDPLIRWEAYCGCALVTIALFLASRFERVLLAGDTDHETQPGIGLGRMVDQLWSTEQLEIVDDGGRFNRQERLRRIADHPLVRRSLRVCWENPDGAYNCGRCRKCLLTMISLEAYGVRDGMETFPAELDLNRLVDLEIDQRLSLALAEDVLDTVRGAGRTDLERPMEELIVRGRRTLGRPPAQRARRSPGPPPTTRLAVVVPAWRQARYLAGAVQSALDQEIECGVGVVIVNDGCPDPETDRIGRTLRDADPDRIVYLRQPNGGVSAARNVGIERALSRWPHVEAVFPLDADNQLSPHTLAELRAQLEANLGADWASPTLEFFGAELGGWQIPGPYLPYRQLFANQCDTGSLIRRAVFDAGFRYDETIKEGFEDWEFFLCASLAGRRGLLAGRCGFRYRRRPQSMLMDAQQKAESLEAKIRDLHAAAFQPRALAHREHAEAPRFAVLLCDRGEARLTAACDLEPRILSIADYARSIAAGRGEVPIPAVTVFTDSATADGLGSAALAEALFRLQVELRDASFVGLRIAGEEDEPAALAVRANALPLIRHGVPAPDALVELDSPARVRRVPRPAARARAVKAIALAIEEAGTPPPESHTAFLEHRHIDLMQTTYPWSSGEPAAVTA